MVILWAIEARQFLHTYLAITKSPTRLDIEKGSKSIMEKHQNLL